MNRSRKSDLPGGCRPADRQLTGQQGALLVDRREREPVVVDAGFRALREEGVDEARLPVQPAVRRVVEHRERRVAERMAEVFVAAEDVAVREHDVAEDLPGGDHRGR